MPAKTEKSCAACTQRNQRCTKSTLPWSRYCFYHQDPMPWVSVVIAIAVAVVVAAYQNRLPSVTVACSPLLDRPEAIHCVASNAGRAPADTVIVGFNKQVPTATRVDANPAFGITLRLADTLPDPTAEPSLSSILRAFSVEIPRVPVSSPVEFDVTTTDPDNIRTARQVVRIRGAIESVVRDFHAAVKSKYPDEVKGWPLSTYFSARRKSDCFFLPSTFVYELGEFPVSFLSDEELRATAANQDTYARRKAEFISIFSGRPSYKAPVLRIETTDGPRTFAFFPPYVPTFAEMKGPLDKEHGSSVVLYPPVPERY